MLKQDAHSFKSATFSPACWRLNDAQTGCGKQSGSNTLWLVGERGHFDHENPLSPIMAITVPYLRKPLIRGIALTS
jgi:hypothetical protein